MQKNLVKTESVAEFVARGGTIKKCPTKEARRTNRRTKEIKSEEVDMSLLPMSLKIRFGVR